MLFYHSFVFLPTLNGFSAYPRLSILLDAYDSYLVCHQSQN
jgi:hypothetical protein